MDFDKSFIPYIIQGIFAILIAACGFLINGIAKSMDKLEGKIKDDKFEIMSAVSVNKNDIDKRLEIKTHDNERRIERLEGAQKDQDQNHAAFRESAAEKYATRQELKEATQQTSATLIRLEQKIDSWGSRQGGRRANDE